jgi:cephalosporin-C deacetylase-like acetyl esterase
MKQTNFILLLIVTLFVNGELDAQPARSYINIVIAPSHENWTYEIGETAGFEICVTRNSVRFDDLTLDYEYGPEKMDPVKKGSLKLKNGTASLKVPGLKTAGFQTVKISTTIEGKAYSNYTTVGYEPEKIQPTVQLPDDFEMFWNNAKYEASRIPLKARMTLAPERCTDNVDVYFIEYQNDATGSFMHGALCVPKAPGTYPAILRVPGAGVRPYYGDVDLASKGVVSLEIGIHGIPVDLPQRLYDNLRTGALNNYMANKLDDRNNYYYKRVYLGCVRAVDFLLTLDKVDKQRIAVTGGSQGGALSIVTAGLDDRIKYLAPQYPALCDITGYLHNRAGGWPHMFRNPLEADIQKKVEVIQYYDVVNFARFVKMPGYYCWGYNDPTCPPTSMYSAYNVIPGEKELVLYQETGHWLYNEEYQGVQDWLLKKLGVTQNK